jgi:hypothetical protein
VDRKTSNFQKFLIASTVAQVHKQVNAVLSTDEILEAMEMEVNTQYYDDIIIGGSKAGKTLALALVAIRFS